jgi:hypothetical protein
MRQEVGTMTDARLSGIGGRFVVVGLVAYLAHLVARSILTAGVDPAVSAQAVLWTPVNALGALGAALVLLGLPAVSAGLGGQGGPRGLVGLALIAASWMFFGLFLSLYGALVLPWLADQAPRLIDGSSPAPLTFLAAFALALVAWLVGALLLAIPFAMGSARPRWAGFALPISALWAIAGTFFIAPDGPASDLAVNLFSNLGPSLLLIGLARLGIRSRVERAPAAAHGASQPA